MNDALRILKDGVTVNVGPTPVTPTLLPLNLAGESPRAVRVLTDVNGAYVAVGPAAAGVSSASLTATLNSTLVNPNEAVYLNTRGCQYFNAITRGTLSTNINVVAVEL